jgi:hypothetical protein
MVKDNLIIVISPLSPPESMRGFLEAFLDVKLKQVSSEPLRYEIHDAK